MPAKPELDASNERVDDDFEEIEPLSDIAADDMLQPVEGS